MADSRDEEISVEVEAALQRDPDADTRWIQAAVAARYREVSDVPLRSFNARFVLPVKRRLKKGARLAAGSRPRRADSPTAPASEDWLRQQLVQLVLETVHADRAGLIDLVAGLAERAAQIRTRLGDG